MGARCGVECLEGGVRVGGWERVGGGCDAESAPRAGGNVAHRREGMWGFGKDICVMGLCVVAYECGVAREEGFGAAAAAHVLTG